MISKKTIALTAAWATFATAAWAEYQFIELPTLTGGNTLGYALNDNGAVVGNSALPFFTQLGQAAHGFRYEGAVITDLGALPGSTPEGNPFVSGAYDINNAGVAVGNSQSSVHNLLGHAVKFVGGEVIDLGTLGSEAGTSAAYGINNGGVIVGRASRWDGIGDAFRLTEGEPMVDLGGLPIDLGSQANAVNDSGLVVGWAGYHAFGEQGLVDFVAVVWESNVIRVIGPLAQGELYPHSEALDVNSAGVVVGTVDLPPPWLHHAFSWTSEGGIVDLGSLGPDLSSFAEGINSHGVIVGAVEILATSYTEHAALYDPAQGWLDLHTAWLPADYVQSRAMAINGQGSITGYGMDVNGNVRAWVLLIPEPATMWLLSLGGLAVLICWLHARGKEL